MRRTVVTALVASAAALLPQTGCEKKQAAAAQVQQAQAAAAARAAEGSATARQRWPEFLEAFSKATDQTGFKVKTSVQMKGVGQTDVWINVTSVVGTTAGGPIIEAPKGGNYQKGSHITVTGDKVKDWVYTADGKTVGDFTKPPPDPNAPKVDPKAKGK